MSTASREADHESAELVIGLRSTSRQSVVVRRLDRPRRQRRCKAYGAGAAGKNAAQKPRRKVEAELLTGTYLHDGLVAASRFHARIGAVMATESTSQTDDAATPQADRARLTESTRAPRRHLAGRLPRRVD